MTTIYPFLITSEKTYEALLEKYQCPEKDINCLNPLIRNKSPRLGQIVYIPIKDIEILDYDNIQNTLNNITKLTKEDYVSYYLKHNDHILIENELLKEYYNLSKLIFNNENNMSILHSHILKIHHTFYEFIDELQAKNEERVNEIKNTLKELTINIINFMQSKNININPQKISSLIELRIKMILMIINENYYDLRNEMTIIMKH